MVFLYRKTGGQVLGVSTDPTAYAGADTTYYGVLTDPTLTNGADLGTPKIWDGSSVRNATAPEIAAFVTAEATDTNLQQRTQASAQVTTEPLSRKVLRSLIDVLVAEITTILSALPRPIVSITRSGTTATATTAGAHGLATNDTVYIHGADAVAYNGAKQITVTGATTFTYGNVSGNPTTPATGSLVLYPTTTVPPVSRTTAQAITAIQNRIAAGTYD
jgi:hypothetical protein